VEEEQRDLITGERSQEHPPPFEETRNSMATDEHRMKQANEWNKSAKEKKYP